MSNMLKVSIKTGLVCFSSLLFFHFPVLVLNCCNNWKSCGYRKLKWTQNPYMKWIDIIENIKAITPPFFYFSFFWALKIPKLLFISLYTILVLIWCLFYSSYNIRYLVHTWYISVPTFFPDKTGCKIFTVI